MIWAARGGVDRARWGWGPPTAPSGDPSGGGRGIARVVQDGTWDGNAEPDAISVRRADDAVFVAGCTRGDVAVIAGFDRRGHPLTGFGSAGRASISMGAQVAGASQVLVDEARGSITFAAARSGFGAPAGAASTGGSDARACSTCSCAARSG